MSNNIKIDNDAIRNQASRLNNLTKRISALDSQFSRLYWQTGSLDVWRVMQSNVLYKRNKKIKNCVKALNATAEEFERLERTHNSGGLRLDGLDTLNKNNAHSVWQKISIFIKNSIDKVGRAIKTSVLKIRSRLQNEIKESVKNDISNAGVCTVVNVGTVSSVVVNVVNTKPTVVPIYKEIDLNDIVEKSSENNETLQGIKSYSYAGQEYSVIAGLREEYCYNQNDYDRFWSNTYNDNVGCTSTSEAIAYSIYHNEEVTPNEMGWGSNGAKWNHSRIIEGTANCSAKETYKLIYENVKNGTPVMFRVKNAAKQNYGHHLTAVGIRNGADPNNLGPNDILVVDPEKGKVESLSDYTKGSYNKNTIIDNDGWSLRVPI